MKVLLPVKRVADPNMNVGLKEDNSDVDLKDIKMVMNPFDEIAISEAVRLKEEKVADELVVVSIGQSESQTVLRMGLACGADRAILIESQTDIEPLAIAKLLAKIVERENPDIILMGKQAVDDDSNQVGQMLAALLNRPQGCFVSSLTIRENKAVLVREVDKGLETLELSLPAVITVDLRLIEPRIPSLPSIMKAKKKPLDTISVNDLGVDISTRHELLSVAFPPKRKAGEIVPDVSTLIYKLKNEAKVI